MSLCYGWLKLPHNTDDELQSVFFYGCPHCNGAECGFDGMYMDFCKECYLDLSQDHDLDGLYTIVNNETLIGRSSNG